MKKEILFQARRYIRKKRMPNTTSIEYPIDKASADFMMRTVLGLLHYKMLQEAEKRRGHRRVIRLSNTFARLYRLYKEKGLDDEKSITEPKG